MVREIHEKAVQRVVLRGALTRGRLRLREHHHVAVDALVGSVVSPTESGTRTKTRRGRSRLGLGLGLGLGTRVRLRLRLRLGRDAERALGERRAVRRASDAEELLGTRGKRTSTRRVVVVERRVERPRGRGDSGTTGDGSP